METPASDTSLPAFIDLSTWGKAQGVPLPEVFLADLKTHRLLVEDLGADTLHSAMVKDPTTPWGTRAFETLLQWQAAARRAPPEGAPHYDDERLSLERSLFGPWFCEALLELTPPAGLVEESAALLETSFREAPRTLVHLDWHGRNLIPRGGGTVAIVDSRMPVGALCPTTLCPFAGMPTPLGRPRTMLLGWPFIGRERRP